MRLPVKNDKRQLAMATSHAHHHTCRTAMSARLWGRWPVRAAQGLLGIDPWIQGVLQPRMLRVHQRQSAHDSTCRAHMRRG